MHPRPNPWFRLILAYQEYTLCCVDLWHHRATNALASVASAK